MAATILPADLDSRREAAGLSVAKLARLACVQYQRAWRACTGGQTLTPAELARIEAALAKAEVLAA